MSLLTVESYHFCILHIMLVLLSWHSDDQVYSLLCHVLHRFTACVQWMPSNAHHFVEHIGVLLPWFTWRLLSAGCINRRLHARLHADSCAFPSEKDPFSLPIK